MGINELKYKDEIDGLSDCPPSNCIGQHKEAYRFIKNIITKESFLPVGIQNPSRKLGHSQKCGAYGGLSMFEDENSAKKRFKILSRTNKKISKSLGNKLAKGQLSPIHGLCSPNNDSGHFTLYEYKDNNVENVFSIIGELSC
jgi:hypothetical protein